MHTHSLIGLLTHLLLGAGILVSALFYIVGYFESRRFFRPAYRPSGANGHDKPLPGVTVLKPLKGLDVELYRNLSTFCEQDHPCFQIIFGVADADDPAVSVVRQLQAAYPRVDIHLVIDRRVYGTNYKVSNLHNMYRAAKHDVILIADSDIRVPSDYLRRVASELKEPGVGLVTCLYRAVPTGGLPTLIESLFINTDFMPMVMVARVVEKPSYAFGATIAMRSSTLDEIGGFLPLASYLADDYQLGHRIAERGYRLVLSDLVVETVLGVGSWRRLLDHQLRWARTYRNCRPGGYFGSIMTHGILWATLALLYTHFSPLACAAAGSIYALRMLLSNRMANAYFGAPMTVAQTFLVPLKDLFISAVWVLCFLDDTVHWSGHQFRVMKDGRMVRISPATAEAEQLVPYPPVREERDRPATSL